MKRRREGDPFFIPEHCNGTIHPYRRIGKIALWILQKTGYVIIHDKLCHHYAVYTRIDVDNVRKAILELKLDLEAIWRHEAKNLYLGPDFWYRFLDECDHYGPFNVPVSLEIVNKNHIAYGGLSVHFIPWMEGWLLV